MDITFSETGLQIAAPSLDDYNFNISQEKVTIPVTPSVSEEMPVEDRIIRRDTDTLADEDAQVTVGWVTGNQVAHPITLESTDEGIGTVDGEGFVERVSDGTVGIIGTGPALSKRVDVDLARVGGQTADTFQRFATGSANAHINAQVEDMLAAADIADGLNVFSEKDIAAEHYVRNPDHWAADVDLTAISPANSRYGSYSTIRQCTLITPRHYIFSYHWNDGDYPSDTIVYFVKANGDAVPVTIAGHHIQVDGVDSIVGLLASEPAGITPMKMLPADWEDYLPTLSGGVNTVDGVGGAAYNQDDSLMAREGYYLNAFRNEGATNSAAIEEFYGRDVRLYDSGSPGIIFVNGEAVLTTTWTYGGGGKGPDLSSNITEINDAIAAVDAAAGISTGYEVEAVDLSEFTNYA